MSVVQVPTKSGNPNHDSTDGQFTSSNGSSSSSLNLEHFEPELSFEEFKNEALIEADLLDSFDDFDYDTKQEILKELKSSYKELETQWKDEYAKEFGEKENNEFVKYDSLDEFVEDAPTKLFTDAVIKEILKLQYNEYPGEFEPIRDNYRRINPLAALLLNARFPRPYMKHCTEEEFNEKVGYLDRDPLHYSRDKRRIEDRIFSGENEWICLYRKIGVGTYDKDEIHTNHYSKQEDLSKTILGGIGNLYGSAIYMSASRYYSESWITNSAPILLGGMVNLKGLKIAKRVDTLQYGGRDRSYEKFRSDVQIQETLRRKLQSRIYSITNDTQTSEDFSKAIVSGLKYDQGCFYLALGYDAMFGADGQLDILNPNKCYLQG